jgi:hypothetical protein
VRLRTRVLIAVGVVVFLAISFELARFFTTESRERQRILVYLQAQAAGDPRRMLDALAGSCRRDPRCVATVDANARRLKRAGSVKILNLQSKTAYALGAKTGITRVAWTVVGNGLPVVQCALVHRGGTAIAGRSVTLLRVSAPIGNESTC